MAGPRSPGVVSFHAVDTLGDEGLVVDAAVCSELRCRSAGIVTGLLVVNAGRVMALEIPSLALVAQQFEAALAAGRPAAVRTGLLSEPKQIRLIGELLRDARLPAPVVAPVLRIGRTRVVEEAGLEAMRRWLYPLARIVVLRAGDLAAHADLDPDDVDALRQAARAVRAQGARSVLVAGAVWRGRVLDLLDDEGDVAIFDVSRVAAPRTPGISGVHAAALAAHLARGHSLIRAADAAQRYVSFRLQRGT